MPKRRYKRNAGISLPGDYDKQAQYWHLTYAFAHSNSFRGLSGAAVKLLIELRCKYNGFNNGNIAIPYDELAGRLHLGRQTLYRAFTELTKKGFIRRVRRGRWSTRQPNIWMLTICEWDGRPATNDWMLLEADQSKQLPPPKRPFPGEEKELSPEEQINRIMKMDLPLTKLGSDLCLKPNSVSIRNN